MNIKFDINTKTKPTDRSWQMCVGSDHAFQAHRRDWQDQLKFAHDELGFRYVRFHGILDDDMNTIQRLSEYIPMPGADKVASRNFYQVGQVYDAVLAAGMKPFVELSFMPSALASGKKTVFHYKGNITLPRNFDEWHDYIKEFVSFLIDRYGHEEVEQWYFEVWNEPDLWGFFKGKQQDYFKLYKYTVAAIKEVDDNLRVGGPSTSSNRWVGEFKAFCDRERVPYDFISTHHYPGDAFGQAFGFKDAKRILKAIKNGAGRSPAEVSREIFYKPEVFKVIPKGALNSQMKTAKSQAGDTPLLYTEWNVASTSGIPDHDTKVAAAFAFKTVLDLDGEVVCYSYWCFSDIFEEMLLLAKPFNGAFGLQTIHGIPKPNFWAFKLLSLLGDERYDWRFEVGDIEAVAFKAEKSLQIAVYKQSLVERSEKESLELEISGLSDVHQVTVRRVDDTHCNPQAEWQKLGSPLYLKPAQVEEIKSASRLQEEAVSFVFDDGTLKLRTEIDVNDIQLFTINY